MDKKSFAVAAIPAFNEERTIGFKYSYLDEDEVSKEVEAVEGKACK